MARLINMNLGYGLPKSCALFDEIPLPCAKSMWLAKTTSEWEDEYKKYLSLRHGSGMPTVGVLRGAGTAEPDSDFVKDLANWSSDVDDLGSLLLLV
jgi:hypothetical protein